MKLTAYDLEAFVATQIKYKKFELYTTARRAWGTMLMMNDEVTTENFKAFANWNNTLQSTPNNHKKHARRNIRSNPSQFNNLWAELNKMEKFSYYTEVKKAWEMFLTMIMKIIRRSQFRSLCVKNKVRNLKLNLQFTQGPKKHE